MNDKAVKYHASRVTNRARFAAEVDRRRANLGVKERSFTVVERFDEFDLTVVIAGGFLRIFPGHINVIDDEVLTAGGEPATAITDKAFSSVTNLYVELTEAVQ